MELSPIEFNSPQQWPIMPRRYTMLTNLRQTSTNSQQARHKLTSGMWRCLPDKLKHDQAAGGSARTAVAAPTARQSHVGSFVLFSSFEMKNINVLKLLLFLGHSGGTHCSKSANHGHLPLLVPFCFTHNQYPVISAARHGDITVPPRTQVMDPTRVCKGTTQIL